MRSNVSLLCDTFCTMQYILLLFLPDKTWRRPPMTWMSWMTSCRTRTTRSRRRTTWSRPWSGGSTRCRKPPNSCASTPPASGNSMSEVKTETKSLFALFVQRFWFVTRPLVCRGGICWFWKKEVGGQRVLVMDDGCHWLCRHTHVCDGHFQPANQLIPPPLSCCVFLFSWKDLVLFYLCVSVFTDSCIVYQARSTARRRVSGGRGSRRGRWRRPGGWCATRSRSASRWTTCWTRSRTTSTGSTARTRANCATLTTKCSASTTRSLTSTRLWVASCQPLITVFAILCVSCHIFEWTLNPFVPVGHLCPFQQKNDKAGRANKFIHKDCAQYSVFFWSRTQKLLWKQKQKAWLVGALENLSESLWQFLLARIDHGKFVSEWAVMNPYMHTALGLWRPGRPVWLAVRRSWLRQVRRSVLRRRRSHQGQ